MADLHHGDNNSKRCSGSLLRMCWGNCRLRESPSTFTTSVSHLTTSPGSFYISASLSTSSSSHELQLLLSHSENSIRCRISLKIFIETEIFNQHSISVVHKKLETSLYLMVRYGMERFWNPLSVNWDMHGLKYISSIEVRNAFFFSQKETKSDTGQPLQSLAILSYEVACVLSTPTQESHLFKNST